MPTEMTDKITILGKVYPFLLSAASAKRFGQEMAKGQMANRQEQDSWKDIEFAAEIIEQSLRDARYARPWYRSLYGVPKSKKLMRILSAREIMEIVTRAMGHMRMGDPKEDEHDPNL